MLFSPQWFISVRREKTLNMEWVWDVFVMMYFTSLARVCVTVLYVSFLCRCLLNNIGDDVSKSIMWDVSVKLLLPVSLEIRFSNIAFPGPILLRFHVLAKLDPFWLPNYLCKLARYASSFWRSVKHAYMCTSFTSVTLYLTGSIYLWNCKVANEDDQGN